MSTDETEERGRQLVAPLIGGWVKPGTAVLDTHRTRQPALWQRTWGDYLFVSPSDVLLSLELKVEERFTGNMFVETFSNQTTDPRFERSGWVYTLNSDALVCVYLDVAAAFAVNMPRLRRWCLEDGHLFDYPQKTPRREQRNRTIGHPVPYAAMWEPVDVRAWQLRGGAWEPLALADVCDLRANARNP